MAADGSPSLDLLKGQMVSQGAEARLWEATFLDRPTIVKQRFAKKYRLPELDTRLTSTRMKQEARSMLRARKLGVATPVLYVLDRDSGCLCMEKVQGRTLKEAMAAGGLGVDAVAGLLDEVGWCVAKMHDGGLIHGDLTTSNLMVREPGGDLVVIDFGLSFYSSLAEDKAVDLYVLERAFLSAHADIAGGPFERVLESYKKHARCWNSVLNKFAEVRMRGRKRTMVG